MSKKPMTEKEKREAEFKKQVRVKMFFVGIVAATILLLAAAKTLAWFTNNKEASVRPLSMKVTSTQTLQISQNPSQGWLTHISTTFDPLKPLCGDGIQFFSPTVESIEETDENGAVMRHREVTGATGPITLQQLKQDALVLDFYLKTSSYDSNVYLDKSSYILPDLAASEENTPEDSTVNVGHIAGAMRASLLYYNTNTSRYELCALWFPNASCELEQDPDTKDYSLPGFTETDGVVEYTGNMEDNYILTVNQGPFASTPADLISPNSDGYIIKNGVRYIWDLQKALDDEIDVFDSMNINTNEKFRLIVWVEGTDRECENILAGGKMNLYLAFTQNPHLDSE